MGVDMPLQMKAQKDAMEATPLPKHTISTISQYCTSMWCNSSQLEEACGAAKVDRQPRKVGEVAESCC